jgi:carotenoid cleavage dioxygenase-like enzyme
MTIANTAPAYLRGHLAPVAEETDAHGLTVTGTLPAELTGRYFRNGPNPLPGQDPHHWFAGDGMLHGIRLREGRADWYRNRWVRTSRLAGAEFVRDKGVVDLAAVTANTNVIRHADRILALVENGLPYEVTPELNTVGAFDYAGRLTTAMTAHPKEDPSTGDLHFFGYGMFAPYLTYHRVNAAGELVVSREVTVPGPTMMHDFAITENHVVWLDLPVVFDMALVGAGMPYRWDDGYGARIGVMRQDGSTEVQWFDVDPCYVFHVGNAREDASGRIVLDAVRYSRDSFAGTWNRIGGATDPTAMAGQATAQLHRWELDPATGRAHEQALDDRSIEFPTINETLLGRASRYRYAVNDDAIVKYDLRTGTDLIYQAGEGMAPGEAEFVPAAGGGGEDAGWLLSIVSDEAGDGSQFVVLDATDMTRTASIALPHRVPAGFHGTWLPDPK